MAEPMVGSSWYHLIEGFQASSKQFYTSVEEAIERKEVPDCSLSRISRSEGGIFSSSREYLRISRQDYKFDICAAPFGTGFFLSWWLVYEVSGFAAFMASIPIIGLLFTNLIKPPTYYQIDTGHMFQQSIRNAVLEATDQMTKKKGIRALSESERKPILREFYRR